MSTTGSRFTEEPNWERRLIFAAIAVIGVIIGYTLLYQWAMSTYTNYEVSTLHSLRIVIESLTTAGFGGDTEFWTSTPLHLIVIAMNLTGVLLVFLAIPLLVVPLFRHVFETRPPTESRLRDHIIIAGFSPQDEVLRAELDAIGIDHLYIETDAELVTQLNEQGINAILGDPEDIATLRSANAEHARALVSDIADDVNPTVILSAKQLNPELRTVSVIRNYQVEEYHRYAGADDVVLARQLLGKSLALRAAASYAERFRSAIHVDTDVEITELLVERGSSLIGQTLREADLFKRTGITVIGAWLGGKFVVSPPPDTEIDENAILLIAGKYDSFEEVRARPIIANSDHDAPIIVCGYGTVGWAVKQTLEEEDRTVTVVDLKDKPGVDIIGDVTDPETLKRAGINEASAIVLALDTDTPAIYTTLVVNQLAPHVEIIGRARQESSVWKLYNAGADFVLALSTVTGEILASLLIEEREIVTPDVEFGFIRTTMPEWTGQTLGGLDIRAKTGCSVIAIERGDTIITDLGANSAIERDDTLILAGSTESQRRFESFVEQ